MAHAEFNKSHFSLKVSKDGEIKCVSQTIESYTIAMISLRDFIYFDENFNSISFKLKNKVYAHNKSHEIIDKLYFSKWDEGKKVPPDLQLQIMKNFKVGMLNKFGVEIEYE